MARPTAQGEAVSTDDCLRCGCPIQDHVPMRYALRCWIRHGVETWRERLIRKIDRWILLTEWF